MAIPYGKLLSAVVAIEHSTGQSKGYGFLEYASVQEAQNAISGLDGRDIDGQCLRVNEIAVDPTSGEAKGFGFVEYSGIEEGMAAIAGLDGRDLRGMALAVTEAKPKARIPSPSDR